MVAPPSLEENGQPCAWANHHAIAVYPDWLLVLATQPAPQLTTAVSTLPSVTGHLPQTG